MISVVVASEDLQTYLVRGLPTLLVAVVLVPPEVDVLRAGGGLLVILLLPALVLVSLREAI